MQRNIKLTIEYDGTNFKGWQIQKKGERTVQDEIERALLKILKEKIKLIASGRTDTGVHALGQCANFKTDSDKSTATIINALNANLSDDIAILKAEEVPLDFHAQYSVKSKTYRYTILNRKIRCAQQRHFCYIFPHKLNLTQMRTAAKVLIGRHDFKSFQATNSSNKSKSAIRRIKRIDIKRKKDLMTIDIEADGFLYKMVRNIVGTLIQVGTGHIHKDNVKKILKNRNRTFAGKTAKAHGLCLLEVKY